MDRSVLQRVKHSGVQAPLSDLNQCYKDIPALHQLDFASEGFSWIDCQDADQSVISYVRRAKDGMFVLVVLNFTPVPRTGYRIGVPTTGIYREIFNSDSAYYGGSNIGNAWNITSMQIPWMGFPDSIAITLPPLAGIIFSLQDPYENTAERKKEFYSP